MEESEILERGVNGQQKSTSLRYFDRDLSQRKRISDIKEKKKKKRKKKKHDVLYNWQAGNLSVFGWY